jgi:hypothetical protein
MATVVTCAPKDFILHLRVNVRVQCLCHGSHHEVQSRPIKVSVLTRHSLVALLGAAGRRRRRFLALPALISRGYAGLVRPQQSAGRMARHHHAAPCRAGRIARAYCRVTSAAAHTVIVTTRNASAKRPVLSGVCRRRAVAVSVERLGTLNVECSLTLHAAGAVLASEPANEPKLVEALAVGRWSATS